MDRGECLFRAFSGLAAGVELVLEGQEIEDGEDAVAVEVGGQIARVEGVLEGEEVEDGEGTVIVEDQPENIKGNPKVQEAYLGGAHL